MEDKRIKDDIRKKLDDLGIIAVEGIGVLTAKDVSAAIDVMDELEKGRDEAAEWKHIEKLQSERAERLASAAI